MLHGWFGMLMVGLCVCGSQTTAHPLYTLDRYRRPEQTNFNRKDFAFCQIFEKEIKYHSYLPEPTGFRLNRASSRSSLYPAS